ncbi:Nicotinate dehydrogenase subunit B [Hartmannibacter diazotrophicus]|uniref:Nicotinate dehydrogenase subunit B n=1 Tax=Hartmannibacter diazotrophicus TaxID=1482074 RepID=A0A2C9DCD8_9HYPH|nr:molybdopterin cofactor-binding domain-containing protein [Hartmannibacter diazotrophicus]SON57984.1 Nicotinate dehydrogenase subunit B [Hartmannibacter diazotrophicus]
MSRADWLNRPGSLAIVAPRNGSTDDVASADPSGLDPYVIVEASGAVIGFNGHVDLGTGIRTALAQIVAEELDVGLARVSMVLGDTAATPDQGPTIASETIQIAADPLRRAAAQARRHVLLRAAEQLGCTIEALTTEDGVVTGPDGERLTYGELIGNAATRLALDLRTPVKPVAEHRIVGQSPPRVDLPAKATGGLTYVHDMRLDGMLHGRVVRPPYAGLDAGHFVGTSLLSVDETSIGHLPGIVAVVVEGDFVGIVAEREEIAEAAMEALKVAWKPAPSLPDMDDLAGALTANPSTPRRLLDKGNVDEALESAARRMPRRYLWPYQMHASIGPSAALARFEDGRLTVWSGTQNPVPLRADLALLLDLPETAVDVIRMEAAGCYGRNGADDVTADAALLARAVGRPVRVQLSRAQEHLWEPKGAAQLMDVDGGLDAAGDVAAYDFTTRYPSNNARTLALLLTGKVPPVAPVLHMGDRTAIGPYDFANHRVTVHDMAPIVRASWLRGVSALPNSFAHECYMDELATKAGVDPVEFRQRYLKDARALELVQALARRAGWEPHAGPRMRRDENGILHGRGFAYALYMHSTFPGTGAAWSAWVADVAVNPETGEVALRKVTVGQDSGLMINPEGVRHQIHGNVIQSTSRVLKEEVTFSDIAVASREWGSYPILAFPEVPDIDVMMVPRPDEPPLGVGESASVPSAAAIANAIFDATGVRFRELPFTPEKIRAGLEAAGIASPSGTAFALAAPPPPKLPRFRRRWTIAIAAVGAVGSIGLASLPIRPAIPPIARPDPAVYSTTTVERGRMLAALGGCITCHTAVGGQRLAGGRPIETPFGTIWSTNLTPDPQTGIGGWSYPAFERAMRQGISRDGRHLFPAFPYTSFAKASEADLQAIYAYLMTQQPVRQAAPPPQLAAPFSVRPLMAAWNTMFHDAAPFRADPSRSDLWNRGSYLVEGLGHCTACHSPRNALGAEEKGRLHLAGGTADGWEAPALTALGKAPIPWDEEAFHAYLSTGYSDLHGVAAGPMAPVIAELKDLPDSDIRAMAHYLASFNTPANDPQGRADELHERSNALGLRLQSMPEFAQGARLYEGACAVCHERGKGPVLFGVKPSLALVTAIQSDTPATLIRVIMEGISVPEIGGLGAMPAFASHLDDGQIAALARYICARFAPDRPAWEGLEEIAKSMRIKGSNS